MNLVREFFLEALQQKKFEDGHLFSTYSETPFALLVDKDKVTIKIVESASVDERKLPIWDPIKVIAVGGESDFDTLKD